MAATNAEIRQVNVLDLSQFIIYYLSEKGIPVNHLKLQKLIYYIDAWHMVFLNRPLIANEFEAWMHGPVVRAVWDQYRDVSTLHDNLPMPVEAIHLSNFVNEEQLEIIEDVLEEYGDKTAYHLERLTHQEVPWKVAREGYAPTDRCNNIVSKTIMREYYQEKLYGSGQDEA